MSYREYANQPAFKRRGTVNLVKNFMSAKIARAHGSNAGGESIGGDMSERDGSRPNVNMTTQLTRKSAAPELGSFSKAVNGREEANKSAVVPERPAPMFRR